MRQILIGFVLIALAGCVLGEATIKVSAENVRRVLKGEIVEVPVHGEVKLDVPIDKWMKEAKCPVCQGTELNMTNVVNEMDRTVCAATTALTLMQADGSCVTGGVKVVDTNVVYWANVDTKFLFGTENAILATSNKVDSYTGFFVLNDKGEFDLERGKCKDMKSQKVEQICRVLRTISKGCRSCREVYELLEAILVVKAYDSVSIVFEGDGRGGFYVETGGKRVASDQIGKEFRCIIHSKDSDKKEKPIIQLN